MINYFEKFKSLACKLPRSTFLFYLAALLVSLPFIEYNEALMQARSSTLNRFMPDFNYLILSQIQQEDLDKTKMQGYFDYYRYVDAYLPNRPDTQATLGYCAYGLGKEGDALNFYKRAVQLFPGSFALQYNLGALYFKKGDYKEAVKCFTQAFHTNVAVNLQFVFSSRIYLPLMPYSKDMEATSLAHVRLGYERCFRLLVLSHERLGEDESALTVAAQATIQSFPHDSFFYLHAGMAAYRLGRYDQAISFLQKALLKQPQDAETMRYLGLSLQALKNNTLTEELLQEANKLQEQTPKEKTEKEKIILLLY